MEQQQRRDSARWCPRTGKPLPAPRAKWRLWLFPLLGLAALIWFLIRVIPKPSRAAYPCQRAAMPLASGFVIWLTGLVGSAYGFRRAREFLRRMRLGWALACLAFALTAGFVALRYWPQADLQAQAAVPHGVLGAGRGIHPGRVVWVHDPDATNWQGTNNAGEDIGDGYWWQSDRTDQQVVDRMMADGLRALTGARSPAAAWDALFRQFNEQRGRGNRGYLPGEKITIKVNMVTANRIHNNVDAYGNQTKWLGWVNTSPQVIMALLRQLVYEAGVAPADITVGDTTCDFPNHYWNYLHGEFPDVHYLAYRGLWGRRAAVSSQGTPYETPIDWSTPDTQGKAQDYLPLSYAEAAYLINAACLKGHSSGVTLCAKNHYGSLIRLPNQAPYYDLHQSLPNPGWSPGMAHYRSLVDMMGHPELGGKTVLHLIDGLYGGYYWEGCPRPWLSEPFNEDWPSSLFLSQDPVAIDSVAHDFLMAEWPRVVTGGVGAWWSLQGGQEDYLHEASLVPAPWSQTIYTPAGEGQPLTASLGVHEHWNNAHDKQYSRNRGADEGIELVTPADVLAATPLAADINGDGVVNIADLALLAAHWLECTLVDVPGCVALSQPAPAPMGIVAGTAVVDGVLEDGEWDDAYWLDMSEVYHGAPSDLSNARWAAKWTEDRLYVVVRGLDTDHVLMPSHSGWNGQDAVEIYVDAANNNATGWSGTWDAAQQYVLSPRGDAAGNWTGDAWVVLGGGTAAPAGVVPAFAAAVNGDELVYEMAIRPYAAFDLAHPANSTLVSLAAGQVIGLDVVMNTKHAAGFGMLCQNTNAGKFNDAGQFLELELLPAAANPGACGPWGYLPGDINRDCRVDLHDLAALAADWLAAAMPADLVAPGAVLVEQYAADNFFEGPMWDPVTGRLYFVAWTTQQVLRLEGPGFAPVWLTSPAKGVNGLFLSNEGRMLTAEVNAHQVMSYAIGALGPQNPIQLAHDPAWMQPNDLCQTAAGDIYFTDPQWGGDHSASAVYRRAPDGAVTKVITDMLTPNGIIASPDGLTLYVSDSLARNWRSYPIRADGSVGGGKVFFDPQIASDDLPDGMTVDNWGNVYLTGLGGIRIVSPAGQLLQKIPVPEKTTNVTFGGADGATLYITGDGKVYSLAMNVTGAN